ncbi:MAG TPA: hypothetical protein VGP25_13765 [Gemmatimonadaceae bacterium]|jgi:hypothetical protein|nr:hypothetical protein [Gemmatimonadaceae bacterium]
MPKRTAVESSGGARSSTMEQDGSRCYPPTREALAGRDFTWYEDVASTLASEGFSPPAAFEPSAWMSRPVASRSLVEYAHGDGGTIVTSWFAMNATKTRAELRIVNLFTLFEDGTTFDTVSGGSASLLPGMDSEREERMPEGTPMRELLARHRARIAAYGGAPHRFDTIAAYHASRQERKQVRVAHWKGLGLSLVERYVQERFTGEQAEVGEAYLDAIRKHPEWYKFANGKSEAASSSGSATVKGQRDASSGARGASAAAPSMPLNFMMSETEGGRRTLTTFGMLFSGVPELLMTDVAANHCRAARVLAGTVASGLARIRCAHANEAEFMAQLVSPSGARITLSTADAIAANVTQAGGSRGGAPLDVRLTLRGFTAEDEPSLLHVDPLPDQAVSFDERLRAACARLGVEVPVARGADSGNDAMREAHERAVLRLDEVRARWNARVVTDEKVLVKFRATKGDVGEYVWLEVRDWRDGALDGELVTPAPRLELTLGQLIAIEQSQVYDQLVIGPSGEMVPALTDVVATDYGMDI